MRLPVFLFSDKCDKIDPKIQRAFTAWLKKTKPDAIFCDFTPLPQMLLEAGYRLPDDIGLASTTVLEPGKERIDAGLDQNSEEIGRVAVLVLLSQINDNAHGLPAITREIHVRGRWVDGASLPFRTQAARPEPAVA